MREVLQHLNSIAGIKGSLVVTPDGIVVISELSNELDEDTTAAYLGNMVTQTLALLKAGEFESLDRMILKASRGKIVIENLDNCLLVVVTNQFIRIDLTVLEIASAAKRIRALGQMSA
ncbi:MAG: roadblock/LC7 domain-containing protein [Planctomycetota bacterium]